MLRRARNPQRALIRSVSPGFIHPCCPTVSKKPPSGPGWAHEVKHDGFAQFKPHTLTKAFRCKKRPPLSEKMMKRIAGDPQSEAGDREPLIGVERVGVIKIAKRLIGEESLACAFRPWPHN
jgi:hypothetical protein